MRITASYLDEEARHAEITGIVESPEMGAKLVDEDPTRRTDMFVWESAKPPRLGDKIEVAEGKIVSYKNEGLLDLLQKTLRRQEWEELTAKNRALEDRNADLLNTLDVQKSLYHAMPTTERTHFQTKTLWISERHEKARENLVADYVGAFLTPYSQQIAFARDPETVAHFNRLIQENFAEQKRCDGSQGIAHEDCLLLKGDRVQFHVSDPSYGVLDGDLGTITTLFPKDRIIAVALHRREMTMENMLFLDLKDYKEVGLGYATTFDRATKIDLPRAYVLADREQYTPNVVNSLHSQVVDIYSDRLTAHVQFPQLAGKEPQRPDIDRNADPLAAFRQR